MLNVVRTEIFKTNFEVAWKNIPRTLLHKAMNKPSNFGLIVINTG